MIVQPFKADHLRRLLDEPSHEYMRPALGSVDHMAAIEREEASFSLLQDSGRVVCCGGVMQMWQGRALAWSVMASYSGPCMVQVHKITKRLLAMRPERRIEATCEADFAAGHRWLRLLGFACEAPRMESFGPDGKAHALYALIRRAA